MSFLQLTYYKQCQQYCSNCDYQQVCQQCFPGFYYQQSNKKCLQCDSSCKSCNGSSQYNCLSCKPGFYLATNQCLQCDASCQTCDNSGSSNCLSCNSGLFYQEDTNQCVQFCNQNQFPNQNLNKCQSCDNSCESCDGPSQNNCLTCNTAFYFQSITQQCLQCDQTCNTCDGPDSSNCLSCKMGLYYQQANKQCVKSCNKNQFPNQNPNQCQPCDNICASCYGSSSNNCLSCNPGYYYQQATKECPQCDSSCNTCDGPGSSSCLSCKKDLYYQQATNQCVQSCNKDQFPNQILNQCQSCDNNCATCDGPSSKNCLSCNPGYYYQQATTECLQCDSSCNTCDGQGSSNCLSCKKGLYYQKATKQCDKFCEKGQFPNQILNQCQPCDNICASCYGSSSNNCLSCNPGYYYQQATQECPQCDSSCNTCDGSGSSNCLSCKKGLYYQQAKNQCVKSCNKDQFPNQNLNQCQPCDNNCASCDGPSSKNCLSCYPGYYYQQTTTECLQCDSSCNTCDGEGSSNCLSCKKGLYYQQVTKKCDKFCKKDQFPNQILNECQSCDSNCASCDGPGQKNCLSCNPGYYYKQATTECLQCDSSCNTCDGPGSSNCLSCKKGLYYQQTTNQCVKSCNKDQFPNQILNQCQSCDNNCASCDGPSQKNCLSCNPGYYYQQTTTECLQCDSSCYTCDGAGSSNCLSCKSGLFYQQITKNCVQSCNSNQFPNQNLNQCQICDDNCSSCDGPSYNNCLSCKINSFLYNQVCHKLCPNGFQSNFTSLTCISCKDYWSQQCNSCFPSCQLCNQQQKQIKECQTCYKETRQLDSNNKCTCKNQNDQRDIFYQCSYKNIAVIDAKLSSISPLLTIDLGSPIKNITSDSSQSLCQQIFDSDTLDMLGGIESQCQLSGDKILVNLSESSKIMENDQITLLPNKLQFIDYSDDFINIFYRNVVFQNPPETPQLQFSYNHIENSCNPLNITLYNIQNDAERKFMSLNWTIIQIQGSINNQQYETIKEILQHASLSKNTTLLIDPKYIPSNINITIQFSYLLKVNYSGSQTFTIIYQKEKFIRVSYQQSVYPPIYRYMSMSFYFQFYIETCEQGDIIYYNEPIDLKLNSNQLQQLSINKYNLSSYQYDILPYSLASNQTFNMSLTLNLSSNNKVVAIQNITVNIQITDLYLQIIGGSSFNLGYQNQMILKTDYRDYEIQDQNSPQDINFSWKCTSFTSNDHICYDYNNKQIQLQQGISSVTFPAKTFQPYTIIQLTIIGQKDFRQSNFTATCIFTELNIPTLNVLFSATHLNQKTNLNDDLNFSIVYGENVSSDYLQYAGAILYNNEAVAAIKFDYIQVKLRIWNYFQDVNPLKPIVQIRFSVSNPLFVMPSISTISIKVNIPPRNCILKIDPKEGIALQTIFEISFLDCTDEDLPLTYQFFYYNTANDAQQEIVTPWNIVRRQIQDQTINNSIKTVLPQGNLVIMGQVMDSQLGVYNSSYTILVQVQNKLQEDYCKFANQLILQSLSNSNMQVTKQLVTLSIISEDISKSSLISEESNDIVSLLIQNIQKLSLKIPEFSLLSTFANKVTAKLSQMIFSSNQQNKVTIQKNDIFKQLQTIVENTNQTIQRNNLSHLQQNNDVQIQNMVDSFKILNSSVTLNTNNSFEDIQNYDMISSQIGNMLNSISLPNQGQTILNGNLSTLLADKVTQKNLFKYVLNLNDSDIKNENSVFSITRNTYKQNIYDDTPEFEEYKQQFKNISQNFTYTQNELISPQIYNSTSQATLNKSTIIYQFNNANESKQYKMACLQKKQSQWDQKNCNINKINENDYICLCKSQQPTTIIEDIEDMFLKNKNLQTAFGEQGLLNILNFENFYMYIVFWLLAGFTLFQIGLFIIGKFLDKNTVKIRYLRVNSEIIDNKQLHEVREQGKQDKQCLGNNGNYCENIQIENNDVFNSPVAQQLNSNDVIQLQMQENIKNSTPFEQQIIGKPAKRKRRKFLNLQIQPRKIFLKQAQEKNMNTDEIKEGSNQLQILKQVSGSSSGVKIKTQTSSQTQIVDDIKDSLQIQKMNIYLQLSKIKKIAIFHQFFSIFYIFDDSLSRSLRFTLLYLKVIHTLAISILFYGYNMLIQQIIIALINSSLMKLAYFGILFTFKKGKMCKWISLILQVGITLAYYYVILAVSSGKTPSESNKFIILFTVSFLIEMLFSELIKSFCMIFLIQKYIRSNNKAKSVYGKLFNIFKIKQTILSIDI